MQKLRLYIDMDGTLARFHDEVMYLERMYEKGFFENLKPFEHLVEAVNQIMKQDNIELYILSAVISQPWCKNEKNKWLDKYLPDIDSKHRIFTDGVQISKTVVCPDAFFIRDSQTWKNKIHISEYNILIDDYNKNLTEWKEAGGTAIKAKNNINHKGLIGELWQGDLIDITTGAENILQSFEDITAVLNSCDEFSDEEDMEW